eukprot:gnl/MRDRNA2_/MRDRNA2_76274_c0_seq1.p1 gnl/MRDRNA2_/MRDRNA2_76274_c0~~gnl/MRDRNA2_/MRDRNA2_76274_c0_seq1.p1  ORF type:complete len:238 (+),score=36.78 gnl/MRDRNA2_/MRDRNA2_76274_c0_seq1:87-716(+)
MCPDLFKGEPWPSPNSTLSVLAKLQTAPRLMWWMLSQTYSKSACIIVACMNWLRSMATVPLLPENIGLLGFCFGGWVAFHATHEDDELSAQVGAAAHCHPAPGVENLHFGSQTSLLRGVCRPTLCLAAGNDPASVKPGGILETSLQDRGCHFEIKEYEDMLHGWVSRGDWCGDTGHVRAAYDDATGRIVGFFSTELSPVVTQVDVSCKH